MKTVRKVCIFCKGESLNICCYYDIQWLKNYTFNLSLFLFQSFSRMLEQFFVFARWTGCFFRLAQSHKKQMKVQGLSLVWLWRLNTYSGNPQRDTWDWTQTDRRWTSFVSRRQRLRDAHSVINLHQLLKVMNWGKRGRVAFLKTVSL